RPHGDRGLLPGIPQPMAESLSLPAKIARENRRAQFRGQAPQTDAQDQGLEAQEPHGEGAALGKEAEPIEPELERLKSERLKDVPSPRTRPCRRIRATHSRSRPS